MDYCGCCGIEIEGQGNWCKNCLPHIIDTHQAPWNNTYFAQFNQDCPFSILVEEESLSLEEE